MLIQQQYFVIVATASFFLKQMSQQDLKTKKNVALFNVENTLFSENSLIFHLLQTFPSEGMQNFLLYSPPSTLCSVMDDSFHMMHCLS